MSTPEVEELAKIQGGKIIDEATGYPSFLPLGEIIGHKRMAPYMDHFKREYMSQNAGAHQGLEGAIRKSGRYGDTEAVILPRHLADIFDNLLYGGKQPGNPHTGKREYFLGGLLNSLGNFFKPIAGAISPIVSKSRASNWSVCNTLNIKRCISPWGRDGNSTTTQRAYRTASRQHCWKSNTKLRKTRNARHAWYGRWRTTSPTKFFGSVEAGGWKFVAKNTTIYWRLYRSRRFRVS
jgi:hypothetical protein